MKKSASIHDHLTGWVRSLLILLFLQSCQEMTHSQPVVQKREDFTVDPGWKEYSTRQPPAQWPQVKQDFGLTTSSPFPTAIRAGQVGGLIARSTVPASYALALQEKTMDQPLKASGKFRVTKNFGNSGVLFGWFHESSRGWRTPNSLAFRLDGNGPGYWVFFEYGTRHGLTGGKGCFEGERYQTTPTKPFPADGSVHTWSLEYDPTGAENHGLITFVLDGKSWTVPLEPGHKTDGAIFNRFGIFNQQITGDGMEAWFADLTLDGEKIDLSAAANWVSRGSKVELAERIVRPINHAGWRSTARAGGRPGEMGGIFWRDDPPAFLATPVGQLTLEDELMVSGKIVMTAAAADSGVYLGWFNAASKTNHAPNNRHVTQPNSLAVAIEGPSRIGHYFRAACWDNSGAGFLQDSGPVILPDGKPRQWTLHYSPKAANGLGEITVSLEGQKSTLALPEGLRERGGIFDHFGFFNFQPDGHFVEVYIDDLQFSTKPGAMPTIEETAREFYGSERARKTLLTFPSRGTRTDLSIPAKSPSETVATFELIDGLQAEAVLHEPIVRQPLYINFDERGRMWVVQFIQYPYPAGVKIIDFDDQFHAVYDRVPPPPPKHDRGADKITIHEDKDGDGIFETHKVFLEGLNMATAVERGRGGVWVLNPPYLVFWPDKNDDDVPDGTPELHLAGFGLEDTHSAANSLRWGPDGWLYGGQGSGVSSTIIRPGLDEPSKGLYFKGQAIWRYHPATRAFELFAEGGGNTFGLEFDSAGRAWSGINGSNHRGFHFVQGGYYSKNFGEHGFFTNPNTFGYFSPMPHDRDVPRFSHTFIVYEGGALGQKYNGKLIAPVPLQNEVMFSELVPMGSTYSTRDVGKFLQSKDRWFRPVDIKTGPDGAVYIADWYDTRLSHMDPRDTWDRAHGRIYRVRAKDFNSRYPTTNLAKLSEDQLIGFLSHSNKWFRQTALRLLWDRSDVRLAPRLQALARDPENPHAIDALWGVYATGGFEPGFALEMLEHKQPLLRAWTVRLIGEVWGGLSSTFGAKPSSELSQALANALPNFAGRDQDLQVRSQLASTARRLDGRIAIPLILALAHRDANASDPHIPLLIWWALEAHAISHPAEILEAFCGANRSKAIWSQPLVQHHLLPRLARLYATEPSGENQKALATLLRAAPHPDARKALVSGINEAFKGRAADQLIESLEEALDQAGQSGDPNQLAVAVRRGDARALREALAFLARKDVPAEERLTIVNALGESRQLTSLPALLQLLSASNESSLRMGALHALGNFESDDIAEEIISRWSAFDLTLKRQAMEILCSRKSWVRRFLSAAGGSGTISKADIPDEVVLRIRLFRDPQLNELCDRYFGKMSQASTAEKQNRIETIMAAVQKGGGNSRAGKELFTQRCAVCHTLFGEGATIGPDLTGSERNNLENMLLNIVDPNVAIREGFTLFQVQVKDGRELLGYITQRDGNTITIRDTAGQPTTLSGSDIQKEEALSTSIMPEGLLDDLTEQQLRDFFTYFMGPSGK